MALSTFKPATSPRLSVVQLSFFGPRVRGNGENWDRFCNDIRQVEDEVGRIRREFVGAVRSDVGRWPPIDIR